jgi:low affinity Fe/Cu permease
MKRVFADIATATSRQSGRPITFLLAALTVIVWGVTGPLFHYSDTWQLVINTGTTIVTFLMVFVIQNTQNRDGAAIQAKLDELIRVSAAKNSLIGIEAMTEDEIADLRATCALPAKKKAANGVRSSEHKKAKAAVSKAMS